MKPCSRSGMRLSSLAAVEEFVPPRARHARVMSAGGVGDAVAAELLETLSLAGGAVFSDTLTESLGHLV